MLPANIRAFLRYLSLFLDNSHREFLNSFNIGVAAAGASEMILGFGWHKTAVLATVTVDYIRS